LKKSVERMIGKGKRLVIENGAETEVNEGLAAMITEAFAIRNQLLSRSDASIEAMSGRLGMNKCRLTSLIRPCHLAPEIVGALLAGRHPIELTPTRLLRRSKNLPHDWKEQRRFLGFALNSHQNPAETLHIRRLENGLERPGGRSRPSYH
jgi:site-specific DNA recombinase